MLDRVALMSQAGRSAPISGLPSVWGAVSTVWDCFGADRAVRGAREAPGSVDGPDSDGARARGPVFGSVSGELQAVGGIGTIRARASRISGTRTLIRPAWEGPVWA